MGTVTVVIVTVAFAGNHIHAVIVINITVAVIIDAVIRNLRGVFPHIRSQINMIVIHTGIDYRHNGTVTGLRIAVVDLMHPAGLDPAAVQVPLIIDFGIAENGFNQSTLIFDTGTAGFIGKIIFRNNNGIQSANSFHGFFHIRIFFQRSVIPGTVFRFKH